MLSTRLAPLLAVALALFLVVSAVPGGASSRGQVALAPLAERDAGIARAADLTGAIQAALGDADHDAGIALAGESPGWAFGTVNLERDDPHAGSRPLLFIARQTGGEWEAATQDAGGFAMLAGAAPDTLLTADQRAALALATTAAAPSLALPWAKGETWELLGGPHRTEVASNRPWSGIDFAGGTGKVRAAAPGTVFIPSCGNQVMIDHGNGWQTVYYHLSSIAVQNGQTVTRGTQLGVIGTGSGCGGTASGPHVHFEVLSRNDEVDIAGQVIGGWTVVEGEIPYNGCLVRDGVRRCAGGGEIPNDGTIGLGSTDPTATPVIIPTQSYCPDSSETDLLGQLNAYRAGQSRQAIPMSRALGAAAERHAADLVRTGRLSLSLSDGTEWGQNAVDHGYNFQPNAVMLRSGTNLTAAAALTAWKSSNNAKLLQADPYGLSLGAGVGHAVDGAGKHYWVLYIGRYLDAPPPCGPGGDPTPTPTKTATSTTPRVVLDKEKSKYNGWVTATLTGFTPNRAVTLSWPRPYELTSGPNDGDFTTTLAEGVTDGAGRLTLRFRTPLEPVGDYTVRARDAANKTDTTVLRVIPRIMLNEDAGPADTRLRVYFYGFGPNEVIEVRWHTTDSTSSSYTVIKRITVASNGRASTLLPIPGNAAVGEHRIVGKVVGVSRSASTTFTLTAGAQSASVEETPTPTGRAMPTATATVVNPTAEPTVDATPSAEPTATATATETPEPTIEPTQTPTPSPTAAPTEEPMGDG